MKIKLFLVVQIFCSSAWSASFDCDKAAMKVEKVICTNEEASKADERFSRKYEEIYKSALEEDKLELKRYQLNWLKGVRNKCEDEKCIVDAYAKQLIVISKYHVRPGTIRIKYKDERVDAQVESDPINPVANGV